MGARTLQSEAWIESVPEGSLRPGRAMEKPWADPNPPYGEKGDFRKVSVTLPPTIYNRLVEESTRRKVAGEPNQLFSCLLREAVTLYLSHLNSPSVAEGT